MRNDGDNPHIKTLKQQFADGHIGRRAFVRFATLLGLAAPTAYALLGERSVPSAHAASMPQGGTLRVSFRVQDLKNPHAYSWGATIASQVVEYLTLTDEKNITHPWLLQKWDVSEDLKTWKLSIRQGVKWHNGEDFTADDVVWNLKHLLDPAVGSSFVGLVKSYLMKEEDGGTDANGKPKKKIATLWDANAIQKIDSHTVQLNLKEPQISVPEHLYHYPATMLYPSENGVLVPGSQGTGPFELAVADIGKRALVKAHRPYWGGIWNEGPYLDAIEFIDLGDDPSAPISALASGQIHGMMSADPAQFDALRQLPHMKFYSVPTAATAVLRMKVTQKPFDDPRVRKAMRLGIDSKSVMEVALRGLGKPGDHIHVAPVQPDYQPIPPMPRNIDTAKKLLAEAGYPNGFETVLYVPNDQAWIVGEAQAAAEQWKEISVEVKLNVVPGTQYWNNWTKVPFGATTWLHRPLGLMVLDLAYRSGVPWNETSYANPAFDKLLDQADRTIDIAKRREIMGKLEEMMHEDGPVVLPLWRDIFTFWHEAVLGYTMHPSDYLFGARLALQKTA